MHMYGKYDVLQAVLTLLSFDLPSDLDGSGQRS